MQSGDTKEENIERVRSGSRGEASAGKVQDAEEKAVWCCKGSKKGEEERIRAGTGGSIVILGAETARWDSRVKSGKNPTCSGTDSS